MTRPSLAGIEARAAAVTIYPFHKTYEGTPALFHVSCSRCPEFGYCGTQDQATEARVAHQAEHAVSDVPALTAAFLDVLAAHPQVGQRLVGFPRANTRETYCTGCQHPSPCPTVRAITAHIDVTAHDLTDARGPRA